MKKTIISLFLALSVLTGLGAPIRADGALEGGTVRFDGRRLTADFSPASLRGRADALQPGDDVTITIELKNAHGESADFWAKNEILKSFLDSEKGGVYGYSLRFENADGSVRELYRSERVGGLDAQGNSLGGLKEINGQLRDYFYLGTVPAGGTGTLELTLKIDGETNTNDYMNTLAKLRLSFAVELDGERVVSTGDETRLLPYLTAAAISGAVLLALAIRKLEKKKKERGGQGT